MLALGIPFLPCQIDNFRVVFSFLLFSVPLGAGLSLSLSLLLCFFTASRLETGCPSRMQQKRHAMKITGRELASLFSTTSVFRSAQRKRAGVGRQLFLPHRSSCRRSFSSPKGRIFLAVRWCTSRSVGETRLSGRRQDARGRSVTQRPHSWLVISVGETGRPSKRSAWGHLVEGKKKKTLGALYAASETMGVFMTRQDIGRSSSRQPDIMALWHARNEPSPRKVPWK